MIRNRTSFKGRGQLASNIAWLVCRNDCRQQCRVAEEVWPIPLIARVLALFLVVSSAAAVRCAAGSTWFPYCQ